MLYAAELKSRAKGHTRTRVGSFDAMKKVCDLNEAAFEVSLRPAQLDDVEAYIEELEVNRKGVEFDYRNSAWSSGPRYRAQLAHIDAQISELRKYLSTAGPLTVKPEVA